MFVLISNHAPTSHTLKPHTTGRVYPWKGGLILPKLFPQPTQEF